MAAIIWKEYWRKPTFYQFDRFLSNYFRENKKVGKKDRHNISEILFFSLRNIFSMLNVHDMESFITEIKKTPANLIIEKMLENNFPKKNYIECFWKNELTERIKKSSWSKSDVHLFLKNQFTQPPIWIRLADQKKYFEMKKDFFEHQLELKKENDFYFVSGNSSLQNTKSFREGLFEIQDAASQKISLAVGAQPGEFIWDACAGGGGKTLAIASTMENKGVIYATDLRKYKLDEAKKRATRSKYFHIRFKEWDLTQGAFLPKEIQKHGGYDKILIDAPCSGSGTWRRNPDGMFRTHRDDLEKLNQLQEKILENAVSGLKKNGKIIYATCSWFVQENESVVEKFLEEHKNFKLEKMEVVGNPSMDSDTMFSSVFKKIG